MNPVLARVLIDYANQTMSVVSAVANLVLGPPARYLETVVKEDNAKKRNAKNRVKQEAVIGDFRRKIEDYRGDA